MKIQQKFIILFICLFLSFITSEISAQHLLNKPTIAIVGIDAIGLELEPKAIGSIARMQLNKLDKYQVMDIYDVDYLIGKNDFDIENCYGKICMVEAGKILRADKMLTGSVENLGETISFTLRLIDVKSASIEKTEVMEFVHIKNQMSKMMEITVKKMFDIEIDDAEEQKLTKPFDFESSINYPEVATLNLSGPRMGFTAFSGELSSIYRDPLESGGFDATPLMFQFGYQFEVKYLNEGDFQALFEFIPIITGLDQGKFIPSVSVLNGIRSNKTGWEFAFGPVFYILREADGFYDENNEWNLTREYEGELPNPASIVSRLDSRGDLVFDSGFVFAVGKTLKSGRLNIPINAFAVPSKSGSRFGISMGFNASRYK
jgi:hypothetical protein